MANPLQVYKSSKITSVETMIHCPGCGQRLTAVFENGADPYCECGGAGEGSCVFVFDDGSLQDLGPDMDLPDGAFEAFTATPVPDLESVHAWAIAFARHVLATRADPCQSFRQRHGKGA